MWIAPRGLAEGCLAAPLLAPAGTGHSPRRTAGRRSEAPEPMVYARSSSSHALPHDVVKRPAPPRRGSTAALLAATKAATVSGSWAVISGVLSGQLWRVSRTLDGNWPRCRSGSRPSARSARPFISSSAGATGAPVRLPAAIRVPRSRGRAHQTSLVYGGTGSCQGPFGGLGGVQRMDPPTALPTPQTPRS